MSQSTFATITGAASDPSGAAVPGVSVEAREINTGYIYKVVTNDNGLYTVANIREGTFTVKASKPRLQRLYGGEHRADRAR